MINLPLSKIKPGMVTAQSNTSYETAQVRNISLSPEEPSGGNNGQLWFKYTT